MVTSSSSHSHAISLLDTQEFLDHDASHGRMDRVLNGHVTFSAIPDGSGKTQWEARKANGETLPLFRLTIDNNTTASHGGPVVIDAPGGVWVCYEDEGAKKSWCVQVMTN